MDPFDPYFVYNGTSQAHQDGGGGAPYQAQPMQQQSYNAGYQQGFGGGRGGLSRFGGGGGSRRGRGRGGGGGNYNSGGYGQSSGGYDHQRDTEERARRIKEKLYKMGETNNDGEDFFPQSDLFTLKRWIEDEAAKGKAQEETILNAFRVMVCEQPHKTPLTAALLGFLIISPDNKRKQADGSDAVELSGGSESQPESLGIRISKDLVKAFRSHLHSRLWRNVRLSVSTSVDD